MRACQPDPCPHCNGLGWVKKFIGHLGRAAKFACAHCYGTGMRNKYND